MSNPDKAVSSPLFAALAEISFDSVMVTRTSDEHGASEIVYVNDRFSQLTGYSSEDVLGETPGMMQGPKTDRDVLDRLEEDLANDRIFHGKTVNYRKGGAEFDIEWTVKRVMDVDGVTYYVAVQREAG